jgi:hypothetical protein
VAKLNALDMESENNRYILEEENMKFEKYKVNFSNLSGGKRKKAT